LRVVHGQAITTLSPSPTTPILVIPKAGDLRLMVGLLVSVGDIDGLTALLRWLNTHAETFALMNQPSRSDTETTSNSNSDHDLPPLRSVLCAIRLFLAGNPATTSTSHMGDGVAWFQTPFSVQEETVRDAMRHCKALGWPTDDEVKLFLAREGGWMERMARTVGRGERQSKQSKREASSKGRENGIEGECIEKGGQLE